MNSKKHFAVCKYRDILTQIAATENSLENLKVLQNNFCNPDQDNFVCLNPDSYESITNKIDNLEDEILEVLKNLRVEKLCVECDLEFYGINPQDVESKDFVFNA